jgi:hypothetical protein
MHKVACNIKESSEEGCPVSLYMGTVAGIRCLVVSAHCSTQPAGEKLGLPTGIRYASFA